MSDTLIIEEKEEGGDGRSLLRKIWAGLNLLLGIGLLILGVWYVVNEIDLADVGRAFALAHSGYILLALAIILATLAAKTWRWQLFFLPRPQTPPFGAAFWAVMLGQFVNTAVPLVRLGEIARVYALYQQTGHSKARALGTLVVEKTLDLIMLLLTLVVLLPFVVVPDFMTERGVTLGLAAALILTVLYLLAYQTERLVRLVRAVTGYFPPLLGERLLRWAISGLEGLAALRRRRVMLALGAISMLIAFLSVLTPLALFPALGLPFGLREAVLIHIVTTVASALPVPTPARLGVFEFAVIFMLNQFGLDNDSLALSYALLFHLVIVLPQLIFGAIAAFRTNWRWRRPPSDPVVWEQESAV